jgi:integrase
MYSMSIYLRGKSWYYDFIHKGQRYTGSFGLVSRTVAKEELARKKAEVVENRLNPAKARKSPRFEVFAEQYLAWVQANRKPLTAVRVGEVLHRLNGVFGHTKLSNLTAWQIEQFKKARKDAGKAPSTINLDLAILKAMLHKAQEWGKLTDHPGKHVTLLKNPRQQTRFLSEEEEARLLAVCSPALRRVVAVGALTGFRRQELVSLRPEDVDLDRGTVSVAACYAKNGESRTLPVGPRLKALLQDALAARGNTAVVLVNEQGRPWDPDSLTEHFRETCEHATLKPLGPHVLRHTFASRLVMAGVDLRTVQELMGHKTIAMTMRYAHLSPDHKRAAMETLESRFCGKSPATFHNTPATDTVGEEEKVAAIR